MFSKLKGSFNKHINKKIKCWLKRNYCLLFLCSHFVCLWAVTSAYFNFSKLNAISTSVNKNLKIYFFLIVILWGGWWGCCEIQMQLEKCRWLKLGACEPRNTRPHQSWSHDPPTSSLIAENLILWTVFLIFSQDTKCSVWPSPPSMHYECRYINDACKVPGNLPPTQPQLQDRGGQVEEVTILLFSELEYTDLSFNTHYT